MTENNSQIRDEPEYCIGKMSEWGSQRARELKAENRLGSC
jgi:hypothetical protein